jgi:hypothetical protein
VTNNLNETHIVSTIRPIHTILKAHFIDNGTTSHNTNNSNNNNNNVSHPASTNSRVLKSRTSNFLNVCNTQPTSISHSLSTLKKSTPVSCVLFQNDFHLASSGIYS